MPYILLPGESLSRAFARVGRAELRKGRKTLTSPVPPSTLPANVHALRVATKKVRAIARLVAPRVGRKARDAERAMAACADAVAAVRDADAAVSAFEKIRAGLPPRRRSTMDAAREALAERLRHETQTLEGSASLRKVARAVRRQQDRVPLWTPGGNRWRMVGPGLQEGYRRARKAMHQAYGEPNGDTFHAWRRAVKAHRFQVRLLATWAPAELDPRTSELGQLAEWLGDEHDLTMLRRTLRVNRFWFGDDAESYYEVIRRIDQQRRELRLRAQPLGELLFAEPPSALARRMRQHFRDFRRASLSARVVA